MKKYLILLLFVFLPSLLLAQAAGGAIKRPVKKQTTTTTSTKKKKTTTTSTKKQTTTTTSTKKQKTVTKRPTNNTIQQEQQARETQPVGICPDSNHPHAIDLGLPSGTKWACCNVGASKPEGYGNYYAWGETKAESAYQQKDVSDIAGTRYDAATANWGAPWKMPTKAQCKELIENTDSKCTTHNGVNGRTFTSKKNGRTIFLPAAGYRRNGELRYVGGSTGYCWSSTPYGEYDACGLYFDSDYANWYYGYRYGEQSVRPVR